MNKIQTAATMMQTTMKLTVLAAGVMFTSLAAQATTVTFNFNGGTNSSSGFGNVRTFTGSDPSVGVSATAWSLGTADGNFATGQLGRATGYGLWVCNQAEGLGCPSPQHQIDNTSGWDFVLLQFSTPVDPDSISIRTYSGADLDVTYYLGNTASNLSLTGVNLAGLAGLGFGSQLSSDVNTTATSRLVTLSNTGGVNALLVGARIGGDYTKDAFKITGMTVSSVSDVPEPGTFVLTGAALMGLGLYGRRRA